MRKKNALLLLAPLVFTSCVNESSSELNSEPTSDSSTNSEDTSISTKPVDDYDSSYVPPYPIDGVVQPTLKNPQGEFNDLGRMRKSQNRGALPQKGEANLLVVPIEFSDDSDNNFAYSEAELSSLESAFYGEGNSYPSVVEYYNQSSYNQLHLSGVISPVITLEKGLSDYLVTSLTEGKEAVISEIFEEVYSELFLNNICYYDKDFDSDDDGLIDNIIICYSNLPYQYYDSSLASYFSNLFVSETFFNGELETDKKVNSVTFTSGQYASITGLEGESHEYIQRVGELIGLEVLEDLTGNADLETYRAPLAGLDMMDGRILDHSSFSKTQLGWIEPTVVSSSSLSSDEQVYHLKPFESSGDTLLLTPEYTGLYGEYLLVDFYTPTGLNEYDSEHLSYANPYYVKGPKESGVRIYKVNSTLVRGLLDDYSLYEGEFEFDKEITLEDQSTASYVYDYAYTNDYENEYSSDGVIENYPLLTLLSKDGANRYCVDYTEHFEDSNLFFAGDSFGDENGAYFYKDFHFDGNGFEGESLGLSLTVTSLTSSEATITVRRN